MDRSLRARQVLRYIAYKNLGEADGSYRYIQEIPLGFYRLHVLAESEPETEDEPKWLDSWDARKGTFQAWVKQNMVRWLTTEMTREHLAKARANKIKDDKKKSAEKLAAEEESTGPSEQGVESELASKGLDGEFARHIVSTDEGNGDNSHDSNDGGLTTKHSTVTMKGGDPHPLIDAAEINKPSPWPDVMKPPPMPSFLRTAETPAQTLPEPADIFGKAISEPPISPTGSNFWRPNILGSISTASRFWSNQETKPSEKDPQPPSVQEDKLSDLTRENLSLHDSRGPDGQRRVRKTNRTDKPPKEWYEWYKMYHARQKMLREGQE